MAVRVLPPTVEPLTAAEVKLRLRYPRADQDAAIDEWIRAARDMVERYVERGLITQTWRLSIGRTLAARGVSARYAVVGVEATDSHLDWFTHNLTAVRAPRSVVGDAPTWGYVDLPWAAPVQAVESVTDGDGATVDPIRYALDDTVEPARLWWLDGVAPSGVVSIVYRVGYGDAADDVPSALRQTVFALVAQYFLFRAGPPPQSALEETLRQADGYRVRLFA